MRDDRLAQRVMKGERRAVAMALTKVEGDEAGGLLRAVSGRLGRAFVVGVTGPPGTGKSTLIDRLIERFRGRRLRVGVIAIDPSSPVSGGALLGDRIRMAGHTMDEGVFIRSMASRGWSGGLSGTVAEAIQVLDASGVDVILVETIGAGQGDVEVWRVAHMVIVVTMPGLGDDIQVSKAGLMEIGDVYVVNKADLPGANAMVVSMLGMVKGIKSRSAPVLGVSALKDDGMEKLFKAVEGRRQEFLSPKGKEMRRRSAAGMILELAKRRALMQFESDGAAAEAERLAEQIAAKRIGFDDAVRRLTRGQRR